MNAITVLLVAAAVHLAGVDIDSAASARLTLFSDGVPAYEWDLDERSGGVYRFVSTASAPASVVAPTPAPTPAPAPNGELLVVRLPEPEMVYTLVHRGTGETDPPHGLGTVSLAGWRAELSAIVRAGGVQASQPLDAERVLSTWVATDPDSTSDAENGADIDPASGDGDTAASSGLSDATIAVTGRVVLTHSTTSWSLSHPDSRQIVTLTTIP